MKTKLPKGTKVPNHIAIIPDGNRRWARAQGLGSGEGHKKGAEVASLIARTARDWGVHTVTFWGLSTENWRSRSPIEVRNLVKLICALVDKELVEAKKDDARIIHLGRKDRLPKALMNRINKAERETIKNKKYVFNIALDYGGQDEIIRAIQQVIEDKVPAEKVNKKLMDSYMDTADQPYPYPDLIIRTSGEQRLSGLLQWQSDYAETYWERDHLPAMTPEKLKDAILDYSRRRRRFGGNDREEHFRFKPEVAAKLELNWWRLSNIPEGTKFRDYAIAHLVEQWGMSKKLAGSAAKHMAIALRHGNKSHWKKARVNMGEFYKLLRDEVKLAFEPKLAAGIEIKLWQNMKKGNNLEELEEETRKLLSEVYRMSDLQAQKPAHLRALATAERKLAEAGAGEEHWNRAEEYLHLYYRALKDRVA